MVGRTVTRPWRAWRTPRWGVLVALILAVEVPLHAQQAPPASDADTSAQDYLRSGQFRDDFSPGGRFRSDLPIRDHRPAQKIIRPTTRKEDLMEALDKEAREGKSRPVVIGAPRLTITPLKPDQAAALPAEARQAYEEGMFLLDRVAYDLALREFIRAANAAPDNVPLHFIVIKLAGYRALVAYGSEAAEHYATALQHCRVLLARPGLSVDERREIEFHLDRLNQGRQTLPQRDEARMTYGLRMAKDYARQLYGTPAEGSGEINRFQDAIRALGQRGQPATASEGSSAADLAGTALDALSSLTASPLGDLAPAGGASTAPAASSPPSPAEQPPAPDAEPENPFIRAPAPATAAPAPAPIDPDSIEGLRADISLEFKAGPMMGSGQGALLTNGPAFRQTLNFDMGGATIQTLTVQEAGGTRWTETREGDRITVTRADGQSAAAAAGPAAAMGPWAAALSEPDPRRVMERLEELYTFSPAGTETLDGTEVTILGGTLKPQAQPAAPAGQGAPAVGSLDQARVAVGKADGFPRQVVLSDLSGNIRVAVHLRNLVFNPPTSESDFAYAPPAGAQVLDLTATRP